MSDSFTIEYFPPDEAKILLGWVLPVAVATDSAGNLIAQVDVGYDHNPWLFPDIDGTFTKCTGWYWVDHTLADDSGHRFPADTKWKAFREAAEFALQFASDKTAPYDPIVPARVLI